ncbi:MAG: hypothetical protein P8Y53_08775 [Pseudolabrys sp.]
MLARAPDLAADVLYVVGGLYGNLAALQAVERLAAAELSPPRIVFNGDFHWFDAEPDWFAAVERGVAPHAALRGNVESEIARAQDVGAGCGCAYPPSVDDGVVERSNEILTQLRAQAPDVARARLGQLPMHLVAAVGSLRVGIVHGDAASLAGWRFAHDALDKAANRRWLDAARSDSNIDVFACTHTCLACLRDYALDAGRLTVINNGAAGMPNFTGSRFGVVTRIAASPSPHEPLYGLERDRVHMDALTLDYDHEAFLARFLARWPQGSAAHQSYFWRMVAGPDYMLAQAAPQ